jgi:GNAT superfamily N-acetyltransferase
MRWEIRRIRPGEGEQLRDIRLRALSEDPGAFGSTFDEEAGRLMSVWDEAATTRSQGEVESTFVAEAQGAWVGLAAGFRAEDDPATIGLFSMWVAPEARGHGLGRRLVDEVVAWARSSGARAVRLGVIRGNGPAVELYRRAGFLLTGDHRPLRSDPSREVERMMLVLDDGHLEPEDSGVTAG